ncbi:uncharacterized protein LOC110420278 [Herrania umbratica]|uniref:Uncharacterized protein LOC110420278 n=1 Tax=Herrania umbratica TaxID=108875 RepID=A0A6J1AQE8_9ROSI|nr:uncharacterized protein LOC110420278 [Herrania umbratica]
MKNVSRNKFLLCFRPVVDMDVMLESKAVVVDRSQNQASTYVGVKNREDFKPSMTKSSVSDTENSIVIHRPGKKTFSQVIKAVVFEIILVKRVLDRKVIHQGSYSSKHNFPLSCRDKLLDESLGKSVNKALACKEIQDTISKSNSVSSVSSCSSSSSPNSTQNQKRQKLQNKNTYSNHREREMNPKDEQIDRGSSSNSAIPLLLVSLAVTIFWGKICAIFFTSIWLYFLPHQQPAGVNGNQENMKRIPEAKSRDYKKKGHNGRAT